MNRDVVSGVPETMKSIINQVQVKIAITRLPQPNT